jgi:polyhydroxyalkanoate synthesis regulator phasin
MGSKPEDFNPFDPFGAWRSMRDAGMEAWSKAMIQAVNTEEYAKATGAMLNAYLSSSGPAAEAMQKAMSAALQHLQMPSRNDVIGLAERLTNIEMRLDDLDAKLDALIRKQSGGEDRGSGGQEAK